MRDYNVENSTLPICRQKQQFSATDYTSPHIYISSVQSKALNYILRAIEKTNPSSSCYKYSKELIHLNKFGFKYNGEVILVVWYNRLHSG